MNLIKVLEIKINDKKLSGRFCDGTLECNFPDNCFETYGSCVYAGVNLVTIPNFVTVNNDYLIEILVENTSSTDEVLYTRVHEIPVKVCDYLQGFVIPSGKHFIFLKPEYDTSLLATLLGLSKTRYMDITVLNSSYGGLLSSQYYEIR